ncbi:AbiJ-NTD4 domain-containing protein [Variovorax ureilyticus]|uniref:AbiJ-NTD4 domain-containing protein n=1 Tax=Variovorax ureilyticus TaxID=1836198 RepID=UPI003D66EC63
MSDYFSDRENGPKARIEQSISPTVWAGVIALVQGLINSGALGLRFPERCPDGQAICGCDSNSLAAAVIAEMPGLAWPLESTHDVEEGFFSQRQPFAPETLLILDFIEFIHDAVARPIPGKYHDFFSHHHLSFDQQAGQDEFRTTINRIFSRNGVAFEMLSTGRIVRVLPLVLGDELRRTAFNTGDRTLDNMLDECRAKFSDRNPLVRREALERLWDAWERLKSLADPRDKKRSVTIILDATAAEPSLRTRLEAEAQELNSIGNSHLIRHSEVIQVPVIDVDHVDYLFHRLFAMIQLMLKKK